MKHGNRRVEFWKETILRYGWKLVLLIGLCGGLTGCGDSIRSPSPEQLAEFEQAGPGGPFLDLNRVAQARLQAGPYRVVLGDVLQLEMPSRLYSGVVEMQVAAGSKTTHACRVSNAGTITLPDGRQILVKGKSLTEVESAVADAYYPSLVKTRPSIYAQVLEYATANIRIMGAVNRPGIYRVRHDQMSLVAVLMEAGQIVEGGAAMIRIIRSGSIEDDTHFPLRATSFRPIGTMSESPQRASVLSWTDLESQERPTGLSVRFEKEGPLDTTGWLTIESGNAVLIRQWLDIASQYQRQAALSQADGRSKHLPMDQLDTRLSRLAQLMDSHVSAERPGSTAAPSAGWTVSPSGVFVASLGGVGDGVIEEDGAGDILKKRVYDGSESSPAAGEKEVTLALPVRGLNIPFADVPLEDGDSVIVERIKPQTISVMGLVARPGSFPYPPDIQYTLAEALALAGGLDMVAEPRYVSVYRLKSDGTVASATFEFARNCKQEHLTEALALKVKPGDVISAEHTLRTRTNVFFDRIVRISIGWYTQPENLWK